MLHLVQSLVHIVAQILHAPNHQAQIVLVVSLNFKIKVTIGHLVHELALTGDRGGDVIADKHRHNHANHDRNRRDSTADIGHSHIGAFDRQLNDGPGLLIN